MTSTGTNDAVFVKCDVNGNQVTALVDTGAAVTLIHRDVFNKVRCTSTKTRTTSCTIVGANNNPLTVRLAAEINLKLEGIVVNLEVLVCDDLAQDLLIGTDIFKPNKFLINFATGTLEVNGKSNHLVFKTSKEVCRVTSRNQSRYHLV